ncbi:type II toxin-antitoxin system RelE/ParE family toxin [Chthoniobacter flavus]
MAPVAEIVLLVRAENDLLRLYAYFESRSAGRGEEFSREVERALGLLSLWPRLGRSLRQDYRRLMMSHFPYSLIYAVEGRRVLIHAVASNHIPLGTILRSLDS